MKTHTAQNCINTGSRVYHSIPYACEVAYEWDILTDKLEWYGKIHEKHGCDRVKFFSKKQNWDESIHPADIVRVNDAINRHFRSGAAYHIQYRVTCRKGSYMTIADSGTALRNNSNTPYKFVGVIQVLD